MRFFAKLATVALTAGTLALGAAGVASAGTFPAPGHTGGPGSSWQGNNNDNHGNQGDGNHGNQGDGNHGCRPGDNNLKPLNLSFTDKLQPWGNDNNKCDPYIPPRHESCNWGWNTSWNYGHNGDLVKHETWGPESWNSRDNRCEFPVVYYPKPQPRPELVCHSQFVSWETPTFGDWLLLEGGPFLHNGETVKFEGLNWTVEDFTPAGTPGANGSQGPGTYFVLSHNGQTLKSTGTPGNHAPFLHEFGTVKVCTWVYPHDNHQYHI